MPPAAVLYCMITEGVAVGVVGAGLLLGPAHLLPQTPNLLNKELLQVLG